MFGISMPELLVVLVVALLVLGPKRLPEIARALGRGLAEFRRATSDITDELRDAKDMIEEEARQVTRAAGGTSAAPSDHESSKPAAPCEEDPPTIGSSDS